MNDVLQPRNIKKAHGKARERGRERERRNVLNEERGGRIKKREGERVCAAVPKLNLRTPGALPNHIKLPPKSNK